jgi:hypothetical protein
MSGLLCNNQDCEFYRMLHHKITWLTKRQLIYVFLVEKAVRDKTQVERRPTNLTIYSTLSEALQHEDEIRNYTCST